MEWGVVATCELCVFFCEKLYVYDVIYEEPFYLLSALKLSTAVLAASVLVKAWVD